MNFYHRFIPHCALIAEALHDLCRNKDEEFEWSTEAQTSFDKLKEAVADAALLAFPVAGAETRVVTDASDVAVGAVLEQNIDAHWRPLSFFSKKLRAAEKKYSTFDKELLAVFLALQHFKFFVEGTNFHVLTDHKPLCTANRSSNEKLVARVQRQL